MDGEHIFSATIVLVMVCAAFPTNNATFAAMNTGLNLLHGMGERGNSHMGARYELLAKLYSAVTPGDGGTPFEIVPQASAVGDSFYFSFPTTAMSHAAFQPPTSYVDSQSVISETTTDQPRFPIIDIQALAEPFYDETANTGMDFGLWEEGFAYPTMDLDLNLAQQQPLTGANQVSGNHNTMQPSGFM